MNDKAVGRARLRWACRRGMLELDLLLIPFFDKYYDDLSLELQSQFKTLLSHPDPDLFAWLMGHQTLDLEDIKDIVQLIKDRT